MTKQSHEVEKLDVRKNTYYNGPTQTTLLEIIFDK